MAAKVVFRRRTQGPFTREGYPPDGEVVMPIAIDAEMCAAFDVECDPTHWLAGWFDRVGLGLATGTSIESMMDEIISDHDLYDAKLLMLCLWLDRNFRISSHWCR